MVQLIAETEQGYRRYPELNEMFRPAFHFVPFNPTKQFFPFDAEVCQELDKVAAAIRTSAYWAIFHQIEPTQIKNTSLACKFPMGEFAMHNNLPVELDELNRLEDKFLARKYRGELTGVGELRLKHIRTRKDQLLGISMPKPEEVELLEKYEALLDQGKELIDKIDQLLEQDSRNGSD